MRLPTALLSGLLLAAAATAQCQFSTLTMQTVAPFCNLGTTGCCAVVEQPTVLRGTLDTTRCAVGMQVSALEGCCGVAVQARILVLGTAPAMVPLPSLGRNCTLWVQPAAVLLLLSGDTFTLPIPRGLPPITLQAQASAIITSPFTSLMVTLTNAHTVALQ